MASIPQPPKGPKERKILTSPGVPPPYKQLRDMGRVAAAAIEDKHPVFGLGPSQEMRYAAAAEAAAAQDRERDRRSAPSMTEEQFRARLQDIEDAMEAEKDKAYCGARGCLRSIFNKVFGKSKTEGGRRRRHHKGKKTLKRARRSTRRHR